MDNWELVLQDKPNQKPYQLKKLCHVIDMSQKHHWMSVVLVRAKQGKIFLYTTPSTVRTFSLFAWSHVSTSIKTGKNWEIVIGNSDTILQGRTKLCHKG